MYLKEFISWYFRK